MAEMVDTAALRAKVAELEAQLAARDAELAALREENAKLTEGDRERARARRDFCYSCQYNQGCGAGDEACQV